MLNSGRRDERFEWTYAASKVLQISVITEISQTSNGQSVAKTTNISIYLLLDVD
jgi:hypothetical protein